MDSNSAVLRPPMTRDETGTLLGQTMGLVAVTAGLFALGVCASDPDRIIQPKKMVGDPRHDLGLGTK